MSDQEEQTQLTNTQGRAYHDSQNRRLKDARLHKYIIENTPHRIETSWITTRLSCIKILLKETGRIAQPRPLRIPTTWLHTCPSNYRITRPM